MLSLNVLNQIELTRTPVVQKIVGSVIRANFAMPLTRTKVTIEGIEKLDIDRPLYIAMNHTDRYNYWPFQVALWKQLNKFTATWVKGKYYNDSIVRRFMIAANNIPTPSKGYIITSDIFSALGIRPSDELYRVVKEGWETGQFLSHQLNPMEKGYLRVLTEKKRNILGYEFDPGNETYDHALTTLFSQMMDLFIALNERAFELGLQILVFPEGTRSVTLSKGRPGLAQMLLRTKASVICVGCNGSELAYPGNNPFSGGGRITYRVGKILSPEDGLGPFQIDEPYRPFTKEADKYADVFQACTDAIMEEISTLLDPQYLRGDGTAVAGSKRFM